MSPMEGLSSIIAVGLLYIAWQQHQTNKNRIKMELFDRRYKIYLGVQKYLAQILRKQCITQGDFNRFAEAVISYDFLFKPKVNKWLNKLTQKATELHHTSDDKKREELLDWLKEQREAVRELFKPYMDLGKL